MLWALLTFVLILFGGYIGRSVDPGNMSSILLGMVFGCLTGLAIRSRIDKIRQNKVVPPVVALVAFLFMSCSSPPTAPTENPSTGSMYSTPSEVELPKKIKDATETPVDLRYTAASRYLRGQDLSIYLQMMHIWDAQGRGTVAAANVSRTGEWSDACGIFGGAGNTPEEIANCEMFVENLRLNAHWTSQYVSQACGQAPSPSNQYFTEEVITEVNDRVQRCGDDMMRGMNPVIAALRTASDSHSADRTVPGSRGVWAAQMIIVQDLLPLLDHNHGGGNCPDGNCTDLQSPEDWWAMVGGGLGGSTFATMYGTVGLTAVEIALGATAATVGGAVIALAAYSMYCAGCEPPEDTDWAPGYCPWLPEGPNNIRDLPAQDDDGLWLFP